jgi:two-component sensor histidine kinase
MKLSALGGRAGAVPPPSILRRTSIGERSRSPSVQKAPLERLLLEHCEKIVVSSSCRGLIVLLEQRVEGAYPVTHERTVLRVVDELLSNSMEHGFCSRQRGHVFVHVISHAATGPFVAKAAVTVVIHP